MNRNLLLLAAHLNPAWSYHDQLYLAKLLSQAQLKIPTTWSKITTWLHELWPAFPGTLVLPTSRADFLTILDDDYPDCLAQIYQPPIILYYAGRRDLLKAPKLAVVGARQCSQYSHQCLPQLIPAFVRHRLVIVSGLAKGVDQLAHEQTLAAGGKTIAVLGNGYDVYYPALNRHLQEQIKQQGLILSEYPPDTPPRKFQFVARNRIIAGLSQGILVTEARQKSGSLITANYALQENRNVYALPGSVLWPASVGTNQLIQAGATPVLTAADVLTDFFQRDD